MADPWHAVGWLFVASVRWVFVVAFAVYFVVQVLALRRFEGHRKKRCSTVLTVILALMFVSDTVRNVFFFENRTAGQVGMALMAVAAIGATIFLIGMFGETPAIEVESTESVEPTFSRWS